MTETLREKLHDVPWLVRELLVTATREKGIDYWALANAGPSHGPKPDTPPVPINFGALTARSQLENTLRDACNAALGYKYPVNDLHASVPTVYAAMLLANLDELHVHKDAEHHRDSIAAAVDNARAVIDRKPEHWYAGRCECGRHLYAEEQSGQIDCGCGVVYDVKDRRKWLLKSAENVLADAATIARCVTWLGGEPVPARRLRVWAHRGKLKAVENIDGHARYRIGDVLDLLAYS